MLSVIGLYNVNGRMVDELERIWKDTVMAQ
jgi:hypothetical protein